MTTAYILLNSQPNSEVEIISKIKEIVKGGQSVKYEIQGVYGVYDIIVKVECESMDDIRNELLKIRRVNKIVSTITMLVNEEQEI
ncbi:MAG: Lrp/AsnC ligand binding domain-containing protein [Nitrosotalea sp.]